MNSLTYYGLFLTSGTMSGNMYLNFFLNSVVEIPSVILYSLTINRYIYILLLFPVSLECVVSSMCNTLHPCHKICKNLVKRASVYSASVLSAIKKVPYSKQYWVLFLRIGIFCNVKSDHQKKTKNNTKQTKKKNNSKYYRERIWIYEVFGV